jgi:NAD(P)-dependent dehydrogenase (short-subunit alcohol dehydrogenase family)
MGLEGRTALVTGSSRGIGRAIALRLAGEGANVIVNFRSREREAQEAVSQIQEKGGKAIACRADVSRFEEVDAMVQEATRSVGPIDILVNNATIHRGRKVEKLPLEDWDLVIKSCLYGAFHCTRCVVPSMKERKWGRIINISSSVGERGYPGDSAYGAAKAGILGFTKSLARELARHGVTVTAVIPGFVLTEMTKSLSADNIALIKASIPVGELCEPEDVAEVVAFLASKGHNITGSIHHVDGGIGI